MKAETDVGAGYFEPLRYVRDHPDARVADLASAFAIGVGTTSKICASIPVCGLSATAVAAMPH